MQLSNVPTKVQVPFAFSGAKNTIPIPSQIGVTPGAASFTTGFPPLTMTALNAGGIPPAGQDFNGILNAVTLIQQWQSAGGSFAYDATWSTANNGYPKGAIISRADGTGFWFNTTDNNTADPDGATPTGWVPEFQFGITAITGLTNANVTLTSLQYGRSVVTLAGTLTGNVQIILPGVASQQWQVVNNTTGAFSVTLKTAAGTGVTVAGGGGVQRIWSDGTNIYSSNPAMSVNQSRFTSNGSFTVPAGVTTVYLSAAAGGGGGGGASGNPGTSGSAGGGGGGGAGQSNLRIPYAVAPGQVIAITIGAAGTSGAGSTGATNGVTGGTGGNTVVGSLVTLTGGTGGTGGVYGAGGGSGGGGGSGAPNGGFGFDGTAGGSGGIGAATPFGGGGPGGHGGLGGGNTGGLAGNGFGAGGGGGGAIYSATALPGAAGGVGIVGVAIFEW